MKKQFFYLLTFTIFTLASIVHGSALQRLKRSVAIATKLANQRATHGAPVRNICNEAGKSQWMPGRGFVSGQYRTAKNVGLGVAMGAAGTIPYVVGYGFTDGYGRDKNEHDDRNSLIKFETVGLGAGMISGVGNFVVAGPVGFGIFWGTIAAVGCAKAAQMKWEQHKANQTKKTK